MFAVRSTDEDFEGQQVLQTNFSGKESLMFNANEIPMVELEAFSDHPRSDVLAGLTSCLNDCGGWVLERRASSATSMEFRVEMQLEGIFELYASLVATGIELTCKAHATLTGLCTCRRNAERLSTAGETVVLRLVLHFRKQPALAMLLATGSAAA